MSEDAVKAEAVKQEAVEEEAVKAKAAKKEVVKEKAAKTAKADVAKKAAAKADVAEQSEPAVAEEKPALSEAAAVMAEGEEPAKAADAAKKKGKGKSIPAGIAFVRSTFNNTLVSIADARGGVIAWSSAGKAGFKGSRKSTAFAATMVAQDAARQAMSKGMHEVEVRIQGAGAGRESAVRAIQSAGMQITLLKDCTPIPHNGCRPRKRRRV